MQTLKNKLHLAAARLSPARAVVVAMLLGPLVGALLAYGAFAAQEPTEVTIDNFTFGPPGLTVAAGTTVKWVNHDDIPHNVVDKNKGFRSKPLDSGKVCSVCVIHHENRTAFQTRASAFSG